jgi:hypothetical protein
MPRRVRLRKLGRDRELPHCQRMRNFTDLASVPSHPLAPFTDRLRLAVAAYLTRFKGSSRQHTESDLRCYLAWCAEHALDPLAARPVDVSAEALCAALHKPFPRKRAHVCRCALVDRLSVPFWEVMEPFREV